MAADDYQERTELLNPIIPFFFLITSRHKQIFINTNTHAYIHTHTHTIFDRHQSASGPERIGKKKVQTTEKRPKTQTNQKENKKKTEATRQSSLLLLKTTISLTALTLVAPNFESSTQQITRRPTFTQL